MKQKQTRTYITVRVPIETHAELYDIMHEHRLPSLAATIRHLVAREEERIHRGKVDDDKHR